MIFDVYLRQLVTLALMDKEEMPKTWRKRNTKPRPGDIAEKLELKEGGSQEDDIAEEFRS